MPADRGAAPPVDGRARKRQQEEEKARPVGPRRLLSRLAPEQRSRSWLPKIAVGASRLRSVILILLCSEDRRTESQVPPPPRVPRVPLVRGCAPRLPPAHAWPACRAAAACGLSATRVFPPSCILFSNRQLQLHCMLHCTALLSVQGLAFRVQVVVMSFQCCTTNCTHGVGIPVGRLNLVVGGSPPNTPARHGWHGWSAAHSLQPRGQVYGVWWSPCVVCCSPPVGMSYERGRGCCVQSTGVQRRPAPASRPSLDLAATYRRPLFGFWPRT